MKNIIVGTAGHIDHGKTALVRALTGVDTDRLEEEKRRGISIDLGFAHLDLPGIRLGFVDVPGHERFVRNMLAGAGGIDLVLLIIAADEGVKPQTREHFDICRLLGIQRGIVVLTKSDLIDAELLELVRLEVEEYVAGSFLAGAPVVAVSSRTGAGLDDLRRALVAVCGQVQPRDATGPARLPIDRAFALKGFGTVVTGTLISGSIGAEDEVEIHPSGRRVRVRSVQSHGSGQARAVAGQRTALNLAGIDTAELHRGMTVTPSGRFRVTTGVDAEFDLLASALPLKDRAPVHFHSGTSEVEAEARLLSTSEPQKPGTRALVRFHLREPVLLWPGDRFIVRMFSPVVTIGGGTVVDIDAPRRLRREASRERLERILREGLTAVLLDEASAGRPAADFTVRALKAPGPGAWLIHPRRAAELQARLREHLAAFHQANPLLPGLPREEARRRILPAEAPAALFEQLLAGDAQLAADADLVRLRRHRVALAAQEDQALGRIENLFRDGGLAVPAVEEVLRGSGIDMNRARTLLQSLLRDKRLVRINMELIFHADAIAALRQSLAARQGQRFRVGDFKEWTGVSRKYAIPLLEYLDRERLTRREGDERVVL